MYHFLFLVLVTTCLAFDQPPKRRESTSKESIEIPRFSNASLCVFHPDFRSVICHSPKGSVECEALGNVSTFSYRIFGIGKFEEGFNFTDKQSIKYFLYPRGFENQTYRNFIAESEGKNYEFYLYHSNSTDSLGFRVSNFECYQRLVDVIQASTEYFDATVVGKESTVKLLGEIMYVDKQIEKRWWLGYGLGYWGLGWPFFGIGWPLVYG